MSETPLTRTELDDESIKDWHLSFRTFVPEASDDIESLREYAVLIYGTELTELFPIISIGSGNIYLTLRIVNATQRQAIGIGYSHLVGAFEVIETPLTIIDARLAECIDTNEDFENDYHGTLFNVSLDMIDLERELTRFRDTDYL